MALLTGCLSVPEPDDPQCQSSADCDRAHGEVCEENICWGNPPAGPFAALVSPPSDRGDKLVSREIQNLVIPDYGLIGDIALEEPVSYTASLHAACGVDCANLGSFGATITITRPSLFPGGPGFRSELTVDADAEGTFTLSLPRTRPTDEDYTVTVVPDGRNNVSSGPLSAAGLLPPVRFNVRVADNMAGKAIDLGGADLKAIDGVITESGQTQRDFRVVALGRWDTQSLPTEVSTVSFTNAAGAFRILLSPNLAGNVELVARPVGDAEGKPTLHLPNVSKDGATNRSMVMPPLGDPIVLTIPVTGVDGSGSVVPIEGAHVIVTGGVTAPVGGGTFATFSAEATTGSDGLAKVTVFNGTQFASNYKLSVVPPAGSESGVVFDVPLDIAKADKQKPLPARLAVRGHVRDAKGDPLKGVQVTARPSLRFQWSLLDAPQAFLTSVPAPTALTPETGEFVVWVDPNLDTADGTVWGGYDLVFTPAAAQNAKIPAPTLVLSDRDLPRDAMATSFEMPDVTMPDPAFIHGRITTPGGDPVEGGELKLFRVEDHSDLCLQVQHAPASCPIPAIVLGRGASDSKGTVRFTLPR